MYTMSTRKRCPNGTRKNKMKECVPSIRLSDEDVDKLMKKYKLDTRARPFLKKLRLRKTLRKKDLFKYDTQHDDATNMGRQADAIIADILKFGNTVAKRKIQRTPKKFKEPLGTRF